MSGRPLTQDEKDDLEQLVDACCLSRVIEALAEICEGKAEHARVNWQDRQLAKLHERNAKRLDAVKVEDF